MKKKKKGEYLPINPIYLTNSKGKKTRVYLKLDVYESILEEVKELEKIEKRLVRAKKRKKTK